MYYGIYYHGSEGVIGGSVIVIDKTRTTRYSKYDEITFDLE